MNDAEGAHMANIECRDCGRPCPNPEFVVAQGQESPQATPEEIFEEGPTPAFAAFGWEHDKRFGFWCPSCQTAANWTEAPTVWDYLDDGTMSYAVDHIGTITAGIILREDPDTQALIDCRGDKVSIWFPFGADVTVMALLAREVVKFCTDLLTTHPEMFEDGVLPEGASGPPIDVVVSDDPLINTDRMSIVKWNGLDDPHTGNPMVVMMPLKPEPELLDMLNPIVRAAVRQALA
jgi:hypothetical protein